MGRPLTGHLELLASGNWRASVPAARGSRKRLTFTFADKSAARQWMAAAIADLEAGRTPAPPVAKADNDRYRPNVVFGHYHRQRYELLTSADPERRLAVRADYDNHIAPFFAAAQIDDIRDIDYDVATNFAGHLSGKPVTVHVSSTGKDVDVAPPRQVLRQSTAENVLSVFRFMLDSAHKRRLVAFNAAEFVTVGQPVTSRLRPRSARPKELRLSDFRAIAANLHVIHQVVLWMLRLLGLRKGEAFGPHVADLIDMRDFGLLTVDRQGGRPFLVYDDDFNIVVRHEKQELKTTHSSRVLVVPGPMMELFRLLIRAYTPIRSPASSTSKLG